MHEHTHKLKQTNKQIIISSNRYEVCDIGLLQDDKQSSASEEPSIEGESRLLVCLFACLLVCLRVALLRHSAAVPCHPCWQQLPGSKTNKQNKHKSKQNKQTKSTWHAPGSLEAQALHLHIPSPRFIPGTI